MTKHLLKLSGSVSVFFASLGLILSVLISPLQLPVFERVNIICLKEEEKGDAYQDSEPQAEPETAVLPMATVTPLEISDLAKASLSSTLFHANREEIPGSVENVVSSVLASRQEGPVPEGNFEVFCDLTPEEYEMLLYCVDHETRNGSLEHRMLIIQVVLNRVQGPKFGSTVKEVLTAPNQFCGMAGFEERDGWVPLELTRQAADQVLSGQAPDLAQGAVYFCNPTLVGEGNWFDTTLEAVCYIEGHRFYR